MPDLLAFSDYDAILNRNGMQGNRHEDSASQTQDFGVVAEGYRETHRRPVPHNSRQSRAENMSEWQDIETAPRDGTEFLAWDSVAQKMDVAYMYNVSTREPLWVPRQVQMDGEYGPLGDEFGCDHRNITHWMPLPEPPPNHRSQSI